MYRIVSLFLAGMLLSSGCLTASQPPAEAEITLVAPADGVTLYDGQVRYISLIGEETAQIRTNYSIGCVVIPPGNSTSPHRLIGSTELVHVIGGAAEIRCDNETVTARAGETVLLPEGALQSIVSVGDADLVYLNAIQPPYTAAIESAGDELAALNPTADKKPLVVADPRAGMEWDLESGVAVFTLLNPVLMNETDVPIDYSVAYAELLPGGYLGYDGIRGSSDILYVIEGEIEVATHGGSAIRVPAGSAAYIPPDTVKETRNVLNSTTTILSFIDPAWTPEKTGLWE